MHGRLIVQAPHRVQLPYAMLLSLGQKQMRAPLGCYAIAVMKWLP